MAWETGTATDHVDLFNKIRNFLRDDPTLTGAGENWTQVLGPSGVLVHGDQVTMKGPGTTGGDNIYCGFDTEEDTGNDEYNIRIWGHAGFSETLGPREQPLISGHHWILTWNQPMTYWIVANGRRWMLAVKVSTVYSSAYCGFMLPYASPSEYPFPMVVAGICHYNARWSTGDFRARFFASPGYDTMQVFYPDNVWRMCANYRNDSDDYAPMDGHDTTAAAYVFPTREYTDYMNVGTDIGWSDFNSPDADAMTYYTDTGWDGSYILRDLTIVGTSRGGPYDAWMGVLDGAYWVPGRANSAENIITKDSVDHLVIQNLYRTGFRDYMALRLE